MNEEMIHVFEGARFREGFFLLKWVVKIFHSHVFFSIFHHFSLAKWKGDSKDP